MNKENCTKAPVTVTPYLTPDRDDDPMMVYEVEGGDLQSRFDSVDLEDEAEVAAVHAENNANAELIAEAFNTLYWTGLTPKELSEQRHNLFVALKEVLRHCVTPGGFPDKGKGRTEQQQAAFDTARTMIENHNQPVIPERP